MAVSVQESSSIPISVPSNQSVAGLLMHKNRLQEFTQRLGIPLPVYQTVNEGSPHDPKFRSSVIIYGKTYQSVQTFTHRKAAEQDVAKVALVGLSIKMTNEGASLIRKDTTFCKSILNEFAVKMNLEKPSYQTSQSGGLLPIFTSSLVFDGVAYTGDAGRSKKEAEQLGARAAILAILGKNVSSGSTRNILTEVIKSKVKLYAALYHVRDLSTAHGLNVNSGGNLVNSSDNSLLNKGKTVATTSENDNSVIAFVGTSPVAQLAEVTVIQAPVQEIRKRKEESSNGKIASSSNGLPAGSDSRVYELVPDQAHPIQHGQVKVEVLSEVAVALGNDTDHPINDGRKRSAKKGRRRKSSKRRKTAGQ